MGTKALDLLLQWVYGLFMLLISPLVWFITFRRAQREPTYRGVFKARMGHIEPVPFGGIWVHAVSVGETKAALILLRGYLAKHAESSASNQLEPPVIVLTVATPTALNLAQGFAQSCPHRVYVRMAPYDHPWALARFWSRVRPSRLWVMETEIWPLWLWRCQRFGVRAELIGARLSAKSARRYGAIKFLITRAFNLFSLIMAQSSQDARRFRALGYLGPLEVSGLLKLDDGPTAAQLEKGNKLAGRLGKRWSWVAGSTREGDEQGVLLAHLDILKTDPDAMLFWIPRHPRRFDEVAKLLARQGVRYCLASDGLSSQALEGAQVCVVNQMGQSLVFYRAARVVFIGGSLFETGGGQNPLEPVLVERPVLIGPSFFNFHAAVLWLEKLGVLTRVPSAQALSQALLAAQPLSQASKQALAQSGGAVQKTLALLMAHDQTKNKPLA